ncbi:transcription antitermination factor NusB [Methylomagnum sp.]
MSGNSKARSLARRCAAQAIYQWQLSGTTLADIEQQFIEELATARALLRHFRAGHALTIQEDERLRELLDTYCHQKSLPDPREDVEADEETLSDVIKQSWAPDIHEGLFKELLHKIPARLDEIDAAIGEFSDRPVADIDPVERAILRIGTYELLFKLDVPYKVAVNESINIAKDLGAILSHKYINGILDKVARRHRKDEAAARFKK